MVVGLYPAVTPTAASGLSPHTGPGSLLFSAVSPACWGLSYTVSSALTPLLVLGSLSEALCLSGVAVGSSPCLPQGTTTQSVVAGQPWPSHWALGLWSWDSTGRPDQTAVSSLAPDRLAHRCPVQGEFGAIVLSPLLTYNFRDRMLSE